MKFLEIIAMVLVIFLSYIVGKYDYIVGKYVYVPLLNQLYEHSFPTMSHNIAAAPYDHFKLAQQSPFVYCKDNPICKRVNVTSPPSIFTIHGLWPNNFSNHQETCSGENFSRAVMDEDANEELRSNLSVSWENFNSSRENMDLWEYQYNKHGKCSDNYFPQTEYFERAHSLWTRYQAHALFSESGIQPRKLPYTYTELEEAIINNTSKTPLLICRKIKEGKEGTQYLYYLLEVRICFDVNASEPVDCNTTGVSNPCDRTSRVTYMAYQVEG